MGNLYEAIIDRLEETKKETGFKDNDLIELINNQLSKDIISKKYEEITFVHFHWNFVFFCSCKKVF